jgi:hypothetical protein
MNDDDMLPLELLFEDDGHLSEIALTAIADGQDAIVGREAHAHASDCDGCTRKLGAAALLSTSLSDALREMPARELTEALSAHAAAAPARISARPLAQAALRFPLRAIAIGLAFALLGALPILMRLPLLLGDAGVIAQRGAPIVIHSGIALLRSGGGIDRALLVLTFGSAFVLIAAALLVLRGMRVSIEKVSQ